MKKLLISLWRGIVRDEAFLLLIGYVFLLLLLSFGFEMLYTIWKALVS